MCCFPFRGGYTCKDEKPNETLPRSLPYTLSNQLYWGLGGGGIWRGQGRERGEGGGGGGVKCKKKVIVIELTKIRFMTAAI